MFSSEHPTPTFRTLLLWAAHTRPGSGQCQFRRDDRPRVKSGRQEKQVHVT